MIMVGGRFERFYILEVTMSKVHADIEALKALRDALPLFVGRQRDAMEVAEREIRRTLELLNQAEGHWRAEIFSNAKSLITGLPDVAGAWDEGADSLRRAGYYLDDLARRSQYSRAEDMRGVVDALMGFVPIVSSLRDCYRLGQALDKLQEVQRWKMKVQEKVESYHGQAQRFGRHLGMEMPRVNLFLDGRIKALEDFYAAQIPNRTG